MTKDERIELADAKVRKLRCERDWYRAMLWELCRQLKEQQRERKRGKSKAL